MTAWRVVSALLLVAMAAGISSGAQSGQRGRRWAIYEREMQNPVDDPPDAWEETEFAFARLRFRASGYRWRPRWGTDANKSERQFIQGLRRLTRIHARSVEQIVDIDSDDIFDWPWLYAIGVGDWSLEESHVLRLRKYFDRGGFLIVDDFHGEREWANFAAGIMRILPESNIVELADDDPIFHTVYDLRERFQVSGLNIVSGYPYERGGIVPHWRGVVDSKGRVQVAICFNMDVGDAWEWADYPPYPERLASLAYRMGVNYVVYAMTH
ncbi:MAG: DUF4159 domain-containing protein [Candidatus Korobacteraceae bacterium]